MQTLLAVLDDLFQFTRSAVFGVQSSKLLKGDPLLLNGMQSTLPIAHAPAATPSFLMPIHESEAHDGAFYFVGNDATPLHTDPVVAFDVIAAFIPYGEQVRLLKLGGRWACVRWKEHEGWIFKDTLRDQARDVFPFFEEGIMYDAQNEETQKLRLCINDAFCGGIASLLLTDAEYVTYKLFQKGFVFPWSKERPRTPGTWQKKLRGKTGVHISIHPQTASVMEYVRDDIGYVAFVDAVFPDETVKLSAIGSTEEGVYSEMMLSKDQWKELRPVFISVH